MTIKTPEEFSSACKKSRMLFTKKCEYEERVKELVNELTEANVSLMTTSHMHEELVEAMDDYKARQKAEREREKQKTESKDQN